MDFLETIDGNLELGETERDCEVVQNGGFQMDNINHSLVFVDGEVIPVNKGEFNLESSLKILNDLTFVEVGNKKPDDIKSDMTKNQGQTFICDSQIYVKNKLARVMVFGKQV